MLLHSRSLSRPRRLGWASSLAPLPLHSPYHNTDWYQVRKILINVGFFFCFFVFFCYTAWHAESKFSDQGSNPCPLQWKHNVLTTGPQGKSQNQLILNRLYMHACLKIQTILRKVQGKVNLSPLNLQSLSSALPIFSCVLPEILLVFASNCVSIPPPFTYTNDSTLDAFFCPSLSPYLLIYLREHSTCLLFF